MGDSGAPRLAKMTVNLLPDTVAALVRLAAGQRTNRTDALNRAIRVAAVLHEVAPDGQFTILRPDGSTREIFLV